MTAFFDTNVLLYILSDDAGKADRAEALMAEGGVISVQVLNEFASVASRKLHLGWPEIGDILGTIQAICTVVPLTVETHERGIGIAARYGYSVYDSLIIAAAIEAGCTTLWSEDMQHSHEIEGLRIANPFLDPIRRT